MNSARNANHPLRLAILNLHIPLPPAPGIRRAQARVGTVPYCAHCPQCGGPHQTKAQFIAYLKRDLDFYRALMRDIDWQVG